MIGRIVNVVLSVSAIRRALVIRAFEKEHVTLVAVDGDSEQWCTHVPHDESKSPGTWHWPRVA